jgi:formate dehydrogenase subunit beta
MVDENLLREAVKQTVLRDDVNYVVGYEKGTYGFQVAPSFAYNPKDAEKFIFSPLCVHNLSVFAMLEEKPQLLKGQKPEIRKIGVVVKGCDSRAIVQIIQEKGLKREDVVIIGIPCTGVVNQRKLQAKFPENGKNVDVKSEKDHFVITIDGNIHRIPQDELLDEKCKHCEYPTPLIHDILIGDKIQSTKKEDYKDIEELENNSVNDKWKYWEKQFEKCIRCYACRNVCPLCYCKECTVDQLDPQWIRRSVDISENTSWNLLRAFHLAGRCIGCGECERACPMHLPLMKLNKKMEKEIRKMFEYTSGVDPEKKPLFAMFKPDDPGDFIL